MLLDLDGTLADSLSVMKLAYRQFLEQFQREPSDAEFESLNGPPLSEVVRRLKIAHAIKEDEGTLLSSYSGIVALAYAGVKPSPGAVYLLSRSREHHCTIGIVTSNTRKSTQTWLDTVNLSHMIDFIVSGEDVTRGKPDPEPYLIAVKQTSCNATEIVAIEDSPQGASSAVGAGLRTFVLGFDTERSWPQGVEPVWSMAQLANLMWH
jgi:HAD superfamily hydrolase (TIGR01509 family)